MNWFRAIGLVAVCIAGALASTNAVAGNKFHTIHDFCTKDVCDPYFGIDTSGLVRDASGNLFGTTANESGSANSGTAFELIPNGTKWKYKLLHNFCSSTAAGVCQDGAQPLGGLIVDTAGNLYGTSLTGSAGSQDSGTVFELIPNAAKTKWKLKVLYSFCALSNCTDGSLPNSGVTYQGAASGAPYDGVSPLYGMTATGPLNTCGPTGSAGCGVAFELTRGPGGWSEKTIYTFCSVANCADGEYPAGGLLMDGSGNLFGMTQSGGANCGQNCGVVFKLTPAPGLWTQTVLHSFCAQAACADGENPGGALVMNAAGSLFGTTHLGGANGYGTLFSLHWNADLNVWTEQVQYSFCAKTSCTDGGFPATGLTIDSTGNLFGTTSAFGGHADGGTIFEFNRTYKVLHSFCAQTSCADGGDPFTPMLLDGDGNLFGTTLGGGSTGWGTAFKLTP